jgi:hypothetical protein
MSGIAQPLLFLSSVGCTGKVDGNEIAAAAQIDQPRFGSTANDDLAIGSLQRRASDDARLLLGGSRQRR